MSQSLLGNDLEQGRAYSLRAQSHELGYFTCEDEEDIWRDTPRSQHDRLGTASVQRPSVSPRTTVSTNITYHTSSVMYGAVPQQSVNTDNSSYSGGYSYPADRDDPRENAQGETENPYDVEQPVTSTPEKKSPVGNQKRGAFGDQTSIPQYVSGTGVSESLEKTPNQTMSWKDSETQTQSIPFNRQEFTSNKNKTRRSSLSDLNSEANPIVIKKRTDIKNYHKK